MEPGGDHKLLATIETAVRWLPDPVLALAVVIAFVLIALLAQRVIAGLAARLVGTGSSFTRTAIARAKGPLRLALLVLALAVAMPHLPLAETVRMMTGNILQVAFIVLVGWILLTAINLAADHYVHRLKSGSGEDFTARKQRTQIHILRRAVTTLIVLLTAAAALMTFDTVRHYGISLFASAGAAGLIVGLAARPVLSNLIAGMQIALTQPIRIDDVVIVEGEWGWVEEITATYVVVRIWDLRRLVVPLTYFIERPFENWTRELRDLICVVTLHADYAVRVDQLRARLREIVERSPHWDGRSVALQVTHAGEHTLTLRATMSAADAANAWNLRCEVREKLVSYMQEIVPSALPRFRTSVAGLDRQAPAHVRDDHTPD